MTERRIKVDQLPEFDPAPYLDNEEAIAAYLTNILEANDSRHDRDRQVCRYHARGLIQGAPTWQRAPFRYGQSRLRGPRRAAGSPTCSSCLMPLLISAANIVPLADLVKG
jgi:hypothetical protein